MKAHTSLLFTGSGYAVKKIQNIDTLDGFDRLKYHAAWPAYFNVIAFKMCLGVSFYIVFFIAFLQNH